MPYATLDTVQGMMAQYPITPFSAVNETQATAIIADISAEVDVALSAAGVSTPVATPATFVEWLGRLNAYGATATILRSMFPGGPMMARGVRPDMLPTEMPAYVFWEQRYQAGLQGIRDGTMVPADVTDNSNFVLPSTYLTRNPDVEEPLGDIAEPLFTVGHVF